MEFYGTRFHHPGQWRIHSALRRWLRLTPAGDFLVERNGLRWLLTPSDFVQEEFFWTGDYDHWVVYHLKRLLSPGAVIVDAGANFGFYSLTLAHHLHDCCIFAFEPFPPVAERLRKNIALNSLEALIQVEQCALSDTAGSLAMESPRPDNSGAARIGGSGTRVRAMTLDDFCGREQLSRLDFVKIDVEGHEPRLLQGAQQALRRFRPLLSIELMGSALHQAGSSVSSVRGPLEDLGYHLYVPHRKELLPLTREPADNQLVNAIAMPRVY